MQALKYFCSFFCTTCAIIALFEFYVIISILCFPIFSSSTYSVFFLIILINFLTFQIFATILQRSYISFFTLFFPCITPHIIFLFISKFQKFHSIFYLHINCFSYTVLFRYNVQSMFF